MNLSLLYLPIFAMHLKKCMVHKSTALQFRVIIVLFEIIFCINCAVFQFPLFVF